ncbi:MAG: DegV family protein [Coriobacteriia bacterium]|nr:DegV family protein [Coriobacteriia bacterium]
MNFTILSDSSANLPLSLVKHYDIRRIPLVYYVDNEELVHNEEAPDQSTHEFYERMRGGAKASTSLPILENIHNYLQEAFDKGKDVLYLGFSTGLSGTYDAVRSAGREMVEKYPHQKFYAVDSCAASGGFGLFVLKVAQKRESGASIEDCVRYAEELKNNISHWFTVESLEYLKRGGRVSGTKAFAANALNIKPVLNVNYKGELIPIHNVRGRKKSLLSLAEKFDKYANEPKEEQQIVITHGDSRQDAEFVIDTLKSRYTFTHEPIIDYVDPIIGAHSGPGTIALFFEADKAIFDKR